MWFNPPTHTHTHTHHLSLSIIWLLSQHINQITTESLCAGAASAFLVTLALKCMRAAAILSLLFNMTLSL